MGCGPLLDTLATRATVGPNNILVKNLTELEMMLHNSVNSCPAFLSHRGRPRNSSLSHTLKVSRVQITNYKIKNQRCQSPRIPNVVKTLTQASLKYTVVREFF